MRFLALALAAAAAATACAGEPLGDRVIDVPLGFTDRTNVGPETARGLATIDTTAGMVVLDVSGMRALDESDVYEGWLAGGGEKARSIARFSVDSSGNATAASVQGELTEATFRRVEITVEAEPDPSPEPSARVSIGGEIE